MTDSTPWERWANATEDGRWTMLCNAREVIAAIADAPNPMAVQDIIDRWYKREDEIRTRRHSS